MKILVLQHLAVEHPGVFRDFLREDGLDWHTVELDEGESIPDLEPYDVMMVMGGPQDTWQEDQFPWLKAEKAAPGKAPSCEHLGKPCCVSARQAGSPSRCSSVSARAI